MLCRRICLIFGLCLTLLGGVWRLPAQQASGLPEWKPDQTLLKQLGPPSLIEGLMLLPPAGYKLIVPQSTPPGVSSYIWVGPERADGSHPVLMLNLLIPPAARPQNLTTEQIAESLLQEFKERRKDWTQTPAEVGTIQGMKFVRIGWTGTDRTENRKMQGWLMAARDGDTFIELASHAGRRSRIGSSTQGTQRGRIRSI